MYRRKLESLPPDFSFATTLEGMGYFLNDKDQIRMIDDPELPFHYFASKNDRFLETHKEAMNKCMSDIVLQRLADLGMETVRLPAGSKASEPHVPVLVSENISRAKRVVIYMGEIQELAFLSGRLMNGDGLDVGSAVNLARDTLASPPADSSNPTSTTNSTSTRSSASSSPSSQREVDSDVALVLTNPGQLTWHRRGQRAVTFDGWYALPRPSEVHQARPITRAANSIPRNAGPLEHFRCVFEDVIAPLIKGQENSHDEKREKENGGESKQGGGTKDSAKKNVRIDVIAVNHSIDDLLTILDAEYTREHVEREQKQQQHEKQQQNDSDGKVLSSTNKPHIPWHRNLDAVACACSTVYAFDTVLQLAGSQGAGQQETTTTAAAAAAAAATDPSNQDISTNTAAAATSQPNADLNTIDTDADADPTNPPTNPPATTSATTTATTAAAGADLAEFWSRRARVYVVDAAPLGTPMTGRRMTGCNVYSSGVPDYSEHIVPLAYRGMLDYFKLVDRDEGYENVPQVDVGDDGGEDGGGGEGGSGWGAAGGAGGGGEKEVGGNEEDGQGLASRAWPVQEGEGGGDGDDDVVIDVEV